MSADDILSLVTIEKEVEQMHNRVKNLSKEKKQATKAPKLSQQNLKRIPNARTQSSTPKPIATTNASIQPYSSKQHTPKNA